MDNNEEGDDGGSGPSLVLQPLVLAVPSSPVSDLPQPAPPPLASVNSSSSSEEEGDDSSSESKNPDHKKRKRRRTPLSETGRRRRRHHHQEPSGAEVVPWWPIITLAVALVCAAVAVVWQPTSQPPPPPLWLTTHDTRSAPLDVHGPLARPLTSYLDKALDALLDKQHYPCLCMHHIMAGAMSNTLYQVCSTVDIRGPLVNPTLVGRGNETDHWTESSSACQTLERGQRRARYRTIWLQWHDVPTGQQMFGRFDGAVAACMQLAMDEMTLGNKVC